MYFDGLKLSKISLYETRAYYLKQLTNFSLAFKKHYNHNEIKKKRKEKIQRRKMAKKF